MAEWLWWAVTAAMIAGVAAILWRTFQETKGESRTAVAITAVVAFAIFVFAVRDIAG